MDTGDEKDGRDLSDKIVKRMTLLSSRKRLSLLNRKQDMSASVEQSAITGKMQM